MDVYINTYWYQVVFYLKHFGQQWEKHEIKSCHQSNQKFQSIGAIYRNWEKYASMLGKIRTMSINWIYFENESTNLRNHKTCQKKKRSVVYRQDETTLKLTSVIRKCSVAPIRHKTIPKLKFQAAVYKARLKRQILRDRVVKIGKFYHWTDSWTVLQWLKSAPK